MQLGNGEAMFQVKAHQRNTNITHCLFQRAQVVAEGNALSHNMSGKYVCWRLITLKLYDTQFVISHAIRFEKLLVIGITSSRSTSCGSL